MAPPLKMTEVFRASKSDFFSTFNAHSIRHLFSSLFPSFLLTSPIGLGDEDAAFVINFPFL